MPLQILRDIERLITERGSAAVLREHVSLIKVKLELVEKDIEDLQEENARLVHRCRELEEQVARQEKSKEFVESRGALFKRLPGGGYDETPFCPKCHSSMWSFAPMFPFECGDDRCGRKASFTGDELSRVIAALPS